MRVPALRLALLFSIAAAVAPASRAQFVPALGYTISVLPDASYPDSGNELLDGVLGESFANYSNAGQAFAYIGWNNIAPTIGFDFAAFQTFSRIELGTTWGLEGIGLPMSVTIGDQTFNLSGAEFATGTREWLVFNGSFPTESNRGSPYISIILGDSHQQWIMLDEVRFTASAVPEPAQAGLLLALLGAGTVLIFRRRTRPPANVV